MAVIQVFKVYQQHLICFTQTSTLIKVILLFLNVDEGNPETDYLILAYRLMHTIGFHFLNPDRVLAQNQSIYFR